MASKDPQSPSPLKVYISYSPEDEKSKAEIVAALKASGEGYEVTPDELGSGDEWNAVLARFREEADVFLVLVSRAYLSDLQPMQGPLSSTVSELEQLGELAQILQRAEAGQSNVIPVILEPCDWEKTKFAKFQPVLFVEKAVSSFSNKRDGIEEVVHALQSLDDLRLKPEVAVRIAACKLKALPELDLRDFGLRHIPRDLRQMPWLKEVRLSGNEISIITNLEELKGLQLLDLSGNLLETTTGVEHFEQISDLYLSHNSIHSLQGLEKLVSLKTLNLSYNTIGSLESLRQLRRLEVLFADGLELTELTALLEFRRLRCISLISNRISSLHSLLPHLHRGLPVDMEATLIEGAPIGIFLNDNPISQPSPEVVALGREAIIDYFDKLDRHGKKELEVLKLILIGNSGVGKTNLSQFLRGEKINPEHSSTDTLDIQNLMMPVTIGGVKKTIRVNVFDFGGQDYYHDLHRLYYSYDTAYVLLWDKASNRYSEQTETLGDGTMLVYEDFPLEYWLESIRYNLDGQQAQQPAAGSGEQKEEQAQAADAGTEVQVAVATDLSITAPVLVLQNKIDLGAGLLNQISLHEKYPNIAGFFSISLSAGKRLKVLHDVLQDCLSKLDLAGRTLVKYQHEVIERYLQGAVEFEVLSLEAFRQKCAALVPAQQQLFDATDAKTVASILTNLGVVYYDRSAPGEGTVFTQISGLNEQIKKIMSLAKEGGDKGIFHWEQVADLPHIDRILPLLLRNQSILMLSETQFLVPQFLPVAPDAQTAHFIRAFRHCQIRYVYTAYFHKTLLVGMFARFFKRKDRTPEDDSDAVEAVSYWRNGLILSQGRGEETKMVFVHFIKEADTCRIEIRSLYPFERTGLERDVEQELDTINRGWSVRKEVSVNSEDFFEVSAMVAQAALNDFVFRKGHNVFTVNDFKYLVPFKRVPKKLFISYSSKDAEFVKRFWTHLNVLKAKGYIEPWYDRKIEPGSRWDESIRREMQSADLVVFLLSPDFLATSYIMDVELKNAMELEEQKHCELFFIQLLQCSWGETALEKYQMQLNPAEAGKSQSFVGSPGNDEMWKLYVESLTEKVKG